MTLHEMFTAACSDMMAKGLNLSQAWLLPLGKVSLPEGSTRVQTTIREVAKGKGRLYLDRGETMYVLDIEGKP